MVKHPAWHAHVLGDHLLVGFSICSSVVPPVGGFAGAVRRADHRNKRALSTGCMQQAIRGCYFWAVSSFYSSFKLSVGLILLSKVDRGLVRKHSAPACPAWSVVL